MLHLFWVLLNIGLFFLFIITCIRSVRLVKERYGIFSAIILAMGLLFMSSSNSGNNNTSFKNDIVWENNDDSSIHGERKGITRVLDDNLMFSIGLHLHYINDDVWGPVPVFASPYIDGTVFGFGWKPEGISIYPTEEEAKFAYAVSVTIEWKLLWVTVFSQSKYYEGIIDIK